MINITRKKISITTKDIILMGVALAVIEVAKVALGFIAGIEIVTLLFVLYTLFFEKKMIYFLPSFLLIEGIVNGFGIWWIMYIYVWSILVLITYLFRKRQSLWFWSIFTGLYGLIFGLLCCPVYIIVGGTQMTITWWIAGIPTDIIHGISNFVLCMVLFNPLRKILERIRYFTL